MPVLLLLGFLGGLLLLPVGHATMTPPPHSQHLTTVRQPFRSFKGTPTNALEEGDLSIVISTIDGGVHTVDAWTGHAKGLFYSGPPLYSSSFFLGAGDGGKGEESQRVNPRDNKYFVMPTLEGRIVCVREDGTQEILAPNVLDLIDNPVMSCPDYEESCGLLLGEKTTKIFALDGGSGNIKWVNSKFKLGGAARAGAHPQAPPGTSPTTEEETTSFSAPPAGGGGGKAPPILLQRDDYVIRSLNVQNGAEEWNVTLSEIFAIGTREGGAGAAFLDEPAPEEEELPAMPDIVWLDERTLRVVDPETQEVLWERELPSAPIGMYTVRDNKWLHLDLPQHSGTAEPSRRVGSGRLLTGGEGMTGPAGGGGALVAGARIVGNQLMGPMAAGGPIATARAARKYGLFNSRLLGGRGSSRSVAAAEVEERQLVRRSSSGYSLRSLWESTPFPRLLPASWRAEERETSTTTTTTVRTTGKPRRECSEWERAHGRCSSALLLPEGGGEGGGGVGGMSTAGTIYEVMVTAPPTTPLLTAGSAYDEEEEEGVCPPEASSSSSSGMYLTFESLATLVVAVFIVGIGFVVLVYQYQPNLATTPKKQAQALDDFEAFIRQHQGAKKTTADGQEEEEEDTKLLATAAPSKSPARAALLHSPRSSSGNGSGENGFQRSNSLPMLGQQLQRLQQGEDMEHSHNGSTNGSRSHRPPLAPNGVRHAASTGSSNPASRTADSFLDSSTHSSASGSESMEGQPLLRLKAMHKPPSASFPATPATVPEHDALALVPAGGQSHNQQLALLPKGGSNLMLTGTTAEATTLSTTTNTTNLTEVLSDASGNPILFLSTQRYKNEFREACTLGKGGFGTVFKSTNKLDGHEYAIKKIRLSSAAHWSQQLEKVLREVKILALLDHPNIIRYYQAWLERLTPEDLAAAAHHAAEQQSYTYSEEDLRGESDSSSLRRTSSSGLRPHDLAHRRGGQKQRRSSAGTLGEYSHSGVNHHLQSLPQHHTLSPVRHAVGEDDEEEEEENSGSTDGRRTPLVPPPLRLLGGAGGGNGRLVAEEHSRISQWSEEEEDDEDGGSVFSESDMKSEEADDDLSHGMVVWGRASDASDAESSSNPGTPKAGGTGSGASTPRRPGSALSSAWSRSSTGTRGGRNGVPRGVGRGVGGRAGRAGMRRPPREPVVFDLCLYIQMQYCSNRTLKDFLELPERAHTVDKAQALQIALQVARGVKYVHERGLIHRDLKPTNCFLVGEGGNMVKIGDFGLSRHVGPHEEEGGGAPTSPRSGGGGGRTRTPRHFLGDHDNTAGVGTPVYGSPEQLSGGDYDEKTDIFSLGVILFELFHPAFGTGMERMLTMRKIHEGHMPPEWARENAELVDVLQRMLNRLAGRRPTANEVVNKLEFLQGKPLVLPLEFDQFPKDAVLLRAETGERDGMLQEVINGIKQHGSSGLMKQYGFRSGNDGHAIIEVLLDGSNPAELDVIITHLRGLEDMISCSIVGVGPTPSALAAAGVVEKEEASSPP